MACKIEGIVKVLHTVETISRARLLQKVNSGTPRARFARARGRRPIVYLPIRENLVIGAVRPRSPARPSAPQAYRWLSHFLACSGAQEKTDCTSMLWSVDSCQNGYPLTSIAWPYGKLRCRPIEVEYFLKLSADKLLVFKWLQAQV